MASTSPARSFLADPYDYAEVRRIAAALDLAEPIAVTLVRRGHRTVEQARAFLEAGDDHDPFRFEGMEEVCERILVAVAAGKRITVHGDYDVDGVCSTAILVAAIRGLGGGCDWLIPDRLADGYGLTMAGVEQLRSRGTELAITVDCGIGCADEVAAAREAGIEMVVTDHHEPPERLPDCPILHPVVSRYPFRALCAAGVAHKLALGLHRVAGRERQPSADLDLVALATVADLVPLIGENRRLVRQGLAAMRASPRPGMRALFAAAGVEAEAIDAGALGFRLGPRINAAGRLYRADAGVELMLTDDHDRAAAIAEELNRANAERRSTEAEVTEAAERARAALPDELKEARGLALAGEGWHAGVVGIAASRLAERHWRPTVLVSFEGGRGRGSARSIPGFDLLGALEACSGHLTRFGGHRAAAGLELERGSFEPFREAFLAHANAEITDADLVRTESVDALVGVGREGIGMDLAEQLERLGPFGKGNPDPRLVVPSARLRTVRPLGQEGRHSRFELESGAGRASGVAFGMNGELAGREDEPIDLSVRVELDRWNGAVQPRVILRELHPLAEEPEAPGCAGGDCPAGAGEWMVRLGEELARAEEGWPPALGRRAPEGPAREAVDRRRGAAIAAIAELVSSGESVLALCADASRRRALAGAAADPRRFGAGPPRIVCCRCGAGGLDAAFGPAEALGPVGPGLVLADWGALARRPDGARRFRHVVMVDPAPCEELESFARLAEAAPGGGAALSGGYLHLAWGPRELELAERCAGFEWRLRGPIEQIWRQLGKGGGEAESAQLLELLRGPGHHPRTAEVAARCVGVMVELGLCEWRPDGAAPALRVVSSERTELERSRAYGSCVARHQETIRYLRSRAQS